MAQNINFLDMNLRLWDYNHTEHYPQRVTSTRDGLPVYVSAPRNRFLQRLLFSGKYNAYCVKICYTIALGAGFPIDYTGIHIGTRHDGRVFREDVALRAKIYPWEYWLGDKAYVGYPEFITEFKGKNLTANKVEHNLTVQHYRGRNEHLIQSLKGRRATMNTRWSGSFSLLAAICKIAAHMVGLEERMKGPRYDVYGPWPMCYCRHMQY